MSSNDPNKLIDQYLERVKIYLPFGSEDTLVEIRTHLIEEAERIGEGTMTAGSAMMAIERIGDPKRVANEFADSGEKVGPVPTEYVPPIIRILVVLIGISFAFIVGAYVVGGAFNDLFGTPGAIQNFPFAIPIMIVVNLAFVFMIIGGLTLLDRDKPLTEKTTTEGILGIGTEALKPKSKLDAYAEVVMGIILVAVLLYPAMFLIYKPAFASLVGVVALLLAADAVKGALFAYGGENSFNLMVEALLSFLWILLAMLLINVGWPTDAFYAYNNGAWQIIDIVALFEDLGVEWVLPFDWIWIFIIFMIVVTNIWRIIAASMKVSMYYRSGKDLWWKGTWGERRQFKKRFWRRSSDSDDRNQDGSTYSNGYQGN